MNTVKHLPPSLSLALMMTFTIPALASVTVSSPSNGEQVGTTFKLSANASSCSSQAVSAMGYSLDNSSQTTFVYSTAIDANVSSGTGTHTLHVKAWGNQGAACVTDVAVSVAGSTSSGGGLDIPSDAASVGSIQVLGNWKEANDSAASGGANGAMALVGSPSVSGSARRFISNFYTDGGERYQVSFGDDESSTNFVYDGWIYLTSSSKEVANLEMDLNQVMSNGWTVIYGFQCDGWSGTWDYTANAGSPTKPKDVWVHSGAACNPRSWSINTWHHVQIYYSRNSSGVVTYHTVWLDGKGQAINATVSSAFALGWAPTLLTNFQVDGYGASGQSVVYLDDLVIYRW
jgi:hypothetical protein